MQAVGMIVLAFGTASYASAAWARFCGLIPALQVGVFFLNFNF